MKRKKQRMISGIMFMVIIIAAPLVFIFSKKSIFSAEENRPLAKMPDLSFSAIADKRYMNDMARYLSDNFPGRIKWVKSKMLMDRMVGRSVINDIYLGDDMLIERLKEPDYPEVARSVNAIGNYASHYHTKTYFMLAPTSAGIYEDKLPGSAPQLDQKKFIDETVSSMKSGVDVIKIYDTLRPLKDEYIYYRTDHHWTSLGAYYAYRQASSMLGFSPIDLDKFQVETVSKDFGGTFYKKCFYDGVKKDSIDIYTYPEGSKVLEVAVNDGGETSSADDIYFRDYLKGSDKYCVFLGNNRAYTGIRTDNNNKKRILVIKDSYANSFVPFLVNHYQQIDVIDLRYVKNSIKDYVDPNSYDQTLFLYNASTFAEDTNVKTAGFF